MGARTEKRGGHDRASKPSRRGLATFALITWAASAAGLCYVCSDLHRFRPVWESLEVEVPAVVIYGLSLGGLLQTGKGLLWICLGFTASLVPSILGMRGTWGAILYFTLSFLAVALAALFWFGNQNALQGLAEQLGAPSPF